MESQEFNLGVETAETNHTKELLHDDNGRRATLQRRKTSSTQGSKT